MDFQKLTHIQQTSATMKIEGDKTDDVLVNACCSPSYLISAMLHPGNSKKTWTDIGEKWERVPVFFDLLIHVAGWLAILIMEFILISMDDKGSRKYVELVMGSFWSVIIGFFGLFLAQVGNWIAGGKQVNGCVYPTTLALILGGVTASTVFSALYYLLAMMDEHYESSHWCNDAETTKCTFATAVDENDKLVHIRHILLWLIAIKLCVVATVKANAHYKLQD